MGLDSNCLFARGFVEALADTGVGFGLHVKVDTGMHRVGVAPALLDDLMGSIASQPNLEVAALWTHFPVADEDAEYTRRQIERFDEVVGGHDVPLVHLANTAGAVLFPMHDVPSSGSGSGPTGLHPCADPKPG